MNNDVIRVAHMMTEMNYGGVEMVIMNYYRHIDKSRFQFDFYVLEGSKIPQKKEIESLGGRIFIVPHYKHIFEYEKNLIEHFKREHYQIVHSNMNTLSVFSLYAAKKANVTNRIAHNHSTAGKGETKKNIVKYLLRPFSKIFPTHLCACSKYAGEWIFGTNAKFKVFRNAIETDKFAYDYEERCRIRKKYNLEDKFVIGHIGRFCYQKNQEFLIDILSETLKVRKNAILLLIGEGETESFIHSKVKDLGLNDHVAFLGKQSEPYKFYQAMDVFIFPSRYEGLGMVAIEAQTSGLATVVSDNVPNEVDLTDCVKRLPLSSSAKKWSQEIIRISESNIRRDRSEEIKNAGYSIKHEAKLLANYYESLING